MEMKNTKPRVLSGIQPSGNMHLGNFLGAIKNWVDDQEKFDNFFMIADYHAITNLPDPDTLKQNKRQLVGLLLACGIDHKKSVLFSQSDVTEHVELTWILTCLTPIGWLERMTQYKDKVQKSGGTNNELGSGLFLYPILMASDILLYQADAVPVGEDQRQHVELTRNIAQRFNSMFGETFNIPKPLIREVAAKVMSLTQPTKKMSKSEDDPMGCIGLLDSPEQIRKKIMRATTDSFGKIAFDASPERAGINNLLVIYQALSGKSRADIEHHFVGRGYGELKKETADLVIEYLLPIQNNYFRIISDASYIDSILAEGALKAKAIASQTLLSVQERMGIG